MFNRGNFAPRINPSVPYYIETSFDNCEIKWPDFTGEKHDGRIVFNIEIDTEVGANMAESGWNIKLKHDEYNNRDYYLLPVEIRYEDSDENDGEVRNRKYTAKDIWMCVGGVKTQLTKNSSKTTAAISSINNSEILYADVTICGKYCERPAENKWWYKAFCTQLFVELKDNDFKKRHGLYTLNRPDNYEPEGDFPQDE